METADLLEDNHFHKLERTSLKYNRNYYIDIEPSFFLRHHLKDQEVQEELLQLLLCHHKSPLFFLQ